MFNSNGEKKKALNTTILIVSMILFVVAIVTISASTYAYYKSDLQGGKNSTFTTSVLDVSIDPLTTISLTSLIPTKDATATSDTATATFSVKNDSNFSVNYELTIAQDCTASCNCAAGAVLNPALIKYKLTSGVNNLLQNSNPISSFSYSSSLNANSSKSFSLWLWLDENATMEDAFVNTSGVFEKTNDGEYISKTYCMKIILSSSQTVK